MDRQTFADARGSRSRWILIGIGLAVARTTGPRWIVGTARGQQPSGEEAKAAAAIEKLGGKVFRDGMLPGEPVIGVDLDETGATDEALALLGSSGRRSAMRGWPTSKVCAPSNGWSSTPTPSAMPGWRTSRASATSNICCLTRRG